jgi:hypothetical protein
VHDLAGSIGRRGYRNIHRHPACFQQLQALFIDTDLYEIRLRVHVLIIPVR